jgi:hypothetical protein
MNGQKHHAVQSWVVCFVSDQGLQFVEKDVLEPNLTMVGPC